MRSEDEMMKLIIDTANSDENVRVAVMNGSRVNPKVTKDLFQDYDVVYYVVSVERFKREFDPSVQFGEIMILQTPEDMIDPPPKNEGFYVYLMLFVDGNHIDLGIMPIEKKKEIGEDSLTRVLITSNLQGSCGST